MHKVYIKALITIARLEATSGMGCASDSLCLQMGVAMGTIKGLFIEDLTRQLRTAPNTKGRSVVLGYRLTQNGWDMLEAAVMEGV